ncbi:MarR family winged helix-turn-helix transcriptional regulator [Phaeodactylibacter xiamenensis]|uniref:MarR family winged helix-turn-helix transcriptional regulator n=1 Tax=Phaeodactylibacter xiamenensis TaxID=1524460 RepID=UPI0024A95008|nr:MarR family transcriptional regulator [Phaeodactylibacter xiamenensis]
MGDKVRFHFEQPEESPGYLLWQVSMAWQRQINRALSPFNLTHSQFVALAALGWLSRQSEEITQKDISNHSNIDRMLMSKLLRALQKRKLIDRQEHPTDTRAKCVFLTPAGQGLLQQAVRAVEAADLAFFAKADNGSVLTPELQKLLNPDL